MKPLINWDDVANWGRVGFNVHHGTTDDLGDHGRHSDDSEDDR